MRKLGGFALRLWHKRILTGTTPTRRVRILPPSPHNLGTRGAAAGKLPREGSGARAEVAAQGPDRMPEGPAAGAAPLPYPLAGGTEGRAAPAATRVRRLRGGPWGGPGPATAGSSRFQSPLLPAWGRPDPYTHHFPAPGVSRRPPCGSRDRCRSRRHRDCSRDTGASRGNGDGSLRGAGARNKGSVGWRQAPPSSPGARLIRRYSGPRPTPLIG